VVKGLVIFLNEFPPDVEQVDLTPGDHDPGESLLICASALVEPGKRETRSRRRDRAGSVRNSGFTAFVRFALQNQGGIFHLCCPRSPDQDSLVLMTGQLERRKRLVWIE
jgi:hypothetical protein